MALTAQFRLCMVSHSERGASVTAQRQPETPYLAALIDDAISRRLVLPEFQRDFKWKPEQVRTLISSISQGWPIGAFMIWRPSDFQMATRPFAGLPNSDAQDDQSYLLDGQQRLTAMIHATHPDYAERRYYFNGLVEYLMGDDIDIDECIEDFTANQFTKRFPDVASRAREDVALIGDVMYDQDFNDWIRLYEQYHPSDKPLPLFRRREKRLPGLKEYQVPCLMLHPRDSLDAVSRIFVTTNSTGLRLNLVDLMTAKVYIPEFRMKDNWEDSFDKGKGIEPGFGNRKNGIDEDAILRILAYWHTGGKRITERYVMAMPAEFVRREWHRAVTALHTALSLMLSDCGAIQSNLLPAPRMAVSLAIALDHLSHQQRDSDEVRASTRQWFWRTVVDRTFDRTTNSRTITEAKRLIGAFQSGNAPEFPPLDYSTAIGDLVERLLDPDGGEGALVAGVHSMIIADGGHDWKAGGKSLTEWASQIESHHIVPRKSDAGKIWERVNCIANLTPQSAASNKELGNGLPLDAGVSGDAVKAHFCDFAEFGSTDRFAKRRAKMLAEAIYKRATGRM